VVSSSSSLRRCSSRSSSSVWGHVMGGGNSIYLIAAQFSCCIQAPARAGCSALCISNKTKHRTTCHAKLIQQLPHVQAQ
jgi:hypothetical protein